MFNETIVSFTIPSGYELPYNRFVQGDIVLLSRESEKLVLVRKPMIFFYMASGVDFLQDVEGMVLGKSLYALRVLMSNPPMDILERRWRLDKGANRVAFDRMKKALDIFTSNKAEMDDYSRDWAQKNTVGISSICAN